MELRIAHQKKLKSSFVPSKSLENFYSGGRICVSKDETFIACCSGEDIKIVDLATGIVSKSIAGDSETFSAVAICPSRNEIVTCSNSLLLKLWDLDTKLCKRSWKGHKAPVNILEYDVSGTLVASGSSDSTIKVWDVEKGYCTHNLKGDGGVVRLVAFHPDSHRLQLISCHDDCGIRVWDLVTSTSVLLKEHMSMPTSLAFSKSGWELISSGRDSVIIIWDLHTNTKKKTIPTYEALESVCVVSMPKLTSVKKKENQFLVTAGEKGILKVWSFEGECVYEAADPVIKAGVTQLIALPTSKDIISVTQDLSIVLHELDTLHHHRVIIGYSDEIIDLKYIDDTKLAVATNSEQIRIFDLSSNSWQIISGHEGVVICLDVKPKHSLLASGSKDNTIKVWDIKSQATCVGTCVGHTEAIGAIAFARGDTPVLVSGSKDKTIKLWSLKYDGMNLDLYSIIQAKDPSGMEIECKATQKAHEKDINSIAFSPNNKIIATGSQDKSVKLWNSADLSLISELKGHRRGIWCVEFSPVEQCLASSSADKTIKIWSMIDFTCLKVWALAIGKDEDEIITGGSDSKLCFWKDNTIAEQQEQIQQNQLKILNEQELSNALVERNFRKALKLAFALDQPFKILTVFEDILDAEEGDKVAQDIIANFTPDELARAMKYIREWNTNAKHSFSAQRVLKLIFVDRKPSVFIENPYSKEVFDFHSELMKKVLEGIIPYTERHFQRIDGLLQKSHILDYTLHRMKSLKEIEVKEKEEKAMIEDEVDEEGEKGVKENEVKENTENKDKEEEEVPLQKGQQKKKKKERRKKRRDETKEDAQLEENGGLVIHGNKKRKVARYY